MLNEIPDIRLNCHRNQNHGLVNRQTDMHANNIKSDNACRILPRNQNWKVRVKFVSTLATFKFLVHFKVCSFVP